MRQLLLPGLFGLLSSITAAAPQNYKLSDRLDEQSGSVQAFFTAGNRTLFLDDGAFPQNKLWSVPNDRSSAPVLIHDGGTEGRLLDWSLTPDGTTVVYSIQTNRERLYSRAADGSGIRRTLSGLTVDGSEVLGFKLSADSRTVVFLADAEQNDRFELYARASDASTPLVKLSPTPVAGGGVSPHYAISPDGAWVVWRGDLGTNEVFGLYSRPVDGSEPARRLDTPRGFSDVGDFAIAFDSFGVVYLADQDVDGVNELHGVRIDGAAPAFKLSGALVNSGDVLDFTLSPVDDRVLYRADQDVNDEFELYSVAALSGGTPVQLNAPLAPGGDVDDYAFTPDGAHVLYRARTSAGGLRELYSVPADGSSPALRVHAAAPGRDVTLFRPGPDSASVFFVADFATATAYELHRAPLDGSAPTERIGATLLPGHRVGSLAFSEDGARVVYTSDEHARHVDELYSVPTDGSDAPVNLNRRMATGGGVAAAVVQGARVVYSARQRTRDALEVFSVATEGSTAPLRLSLDFSRIPAGAVYGFQFLNGGKEVVYRLYASGILDFRHVSIDGGPAQRINTPRGDEDLAAVSPDERYFIFDRPSEHPYSDDLIAVRADGSAEPVWLDRSVPTVAHESYLYDVRVSPDSTHVVFVTNQEEEGRWHLYSASLDGSTPAVRLDAQAAANEFVTFAFAEGGARVVFSIRDGSNAPKELFSVPLDGSQAPVRLSATFPIGGELGGQQSTTALGPQHTLFLVTPDGTRVVYLAEQDANDVTELYVVPVDGSSSPVKLSGTMQPDGDVRLESYFGQPFHLTPDGMYVLYVADAETEGSFELWRAPLDGASAPVKLSGTIVVGGAVGGADENFGHRHESMGLSPDGLWFVYMGDTSSNDVTELWAVRVDGSAAPVRLSHTLPLGGDVYDFRIDAGSSRVAYRSNNGNLQGHDLHVAPLDGSAPAGLVSRRTSFRDNAGGYQFTPDGGTIVFVARLHDLNTIELYARPSDLGAGPLKLNGPLVAGGNVQALSGPEFELTPDGRRVVYMADQETYTVTELFVSFLGNGPGRSAKRGAPDPR